MHSPPNTNDKVDLGLCGDVEVARRTRSPLQADLFLLMIQILLHICLCPLEDDLTLGLRRLWKNSSVIVRKSTKVEQEYNISPERWLISGNPVKNKLH